MSTDWIRSTRNHLTMLSECFPLCSVASWQRDKSCHPSRWIRGPNELCNISLFRIRLRIIIKAEHHSASIYILSIFHWFSRLRYSWETTASKLYLFRTTTIIIVIIKVVSIDLRGRTRNPKVTGHASIKGVFRIGCTGWLTYAHILPVTHTHTHKRVYRFLDRVRIFDLYSCHHRSLRPLDQSSSQLTDYFSPSAIFVEH